MYNPATPLDPNAATVVEGNPPIPAGGNTAPARKSTAPARESTANARSFAELLAEAEAVEDHVVIRHRAGLPAPERTGLPGMVQSAWMMMAHRIPGKMGLGGITKKSARPFRSGGS